LFASRKVRPKKLDYLDLIHEAMLKTFAHESKLANMFIKNRSELKQVLCVVLIIMAKKGKHFVHFLAKVHFFQVKILVAQLSNFV